MPTIVVPILYDNSKNFYPAGKYIVIPTDSEYLRTETLPSTVSIPKMAGYVATTPLLRIKTKEYGEVLVNLLLSQYNALIQAASGNSTAPKEFTTTVSGTPNFITSTKLFNITPLSYSVNGVAYDVRTITYTSNMDGTGTATFPANFSDGDIVQVLFSKN